MARDIFQNGEALFTVRGAAGSSIASVSELGVTEGPIQYSPEFQHLEVSADPWGNRLPFEVQFMLAAVNITATLVHFDPDILDACLKESMGGASATGTLTRAGQRLGGNVALYAADNHFFSVGISSPVAGKPYTFLACYMPGTPITFPLGTERSLVSVTFRCIPHATDPYNGGSGAEGKVLWNNSALS